MKSALTLLITLLTMMSMSATAALYDETQINILYEHEFDGMHAYEAGDYERAFEVLSKTATKGLKDSQYLVALMFMKGDGVAKNILIGFGWLGVAIESGNEEWTEIYNSFYSTLNDRQRAMVDEQVKRYTEKYGGDVQGVTCTRRSAVGDRQIRLRCNKVAGTYPEYEIEMVP